MVVDAVPAGNVSLRDVHIAVQLYQALGTSEMTSSSVKQIRRPIPPWIFTGKMTL